ncbi:gluconate 2-dehydrogenase subunit 3 family protein [Nonomuraea sp. PA05]|uniref:DUF5987 family protein n=1 Tax=Nonomuraea sp. PA05 TaxID=2604466 RepID=UPI0011D7230B|nr:DUF5987 family protein [Nonomuraea sp. PA05]TYB71379.1 gluconate 2-dehydrogenase subunit 3 family protein [Nonomuraea sp. PA05]
MSAQLSTDHETMVTTLEAFADTIIPGAKRSGQDRAVAGASPTGGAVAAGAMELITWDATGIHASLDGYARALNEHAREHAGQHGLDLDGDVPPFVALDFEQRTALVRVLTAPGHPDKALWVLLSLFCYMAYDSAAHTGTVAALEAGHPGLTSMRLARPDPDGLWRFRAWSYGRQLADLHPGTTDTGSPA